MNDFVRALIAEDRIDVARVRALDAAELAGTVADEPARHLGSVGSDAAHAIAGSEGTFDEPNARRQQAPPALAQRRRGAGVEVKRALRTQREGDPVFAARQAVGG